MTDPRQRSFEASRMMGANCELRRRRDFRFNPRPFSRSRARAAAHASLSQAKCDCESTLDGRLGTGKVGVDGGPRSGRGRRSVGIAATAQSCSRSRVAVTVRVVSSRLSTELSACPHGLFVRTDGDGVVVDSLWWPRAPRLRDLLGYWTILILNS